MLKIDKTFTKLFFLIVISFFVFFIAGYFSLRLIIVEPAEIELYNKVWMILGILFLFILIILYLIIKSISYKLSDDTQKLHDYLEEVSNKNYQAVIKIRYFSEFLEMSLRLKNIVKRLNNKDTKKK